MSPSAALAQVQAASMQYQGPIPPAEEIQGWENVLPGAATRILAMAEEQAHHRQGVEARLVKSAVFRASLGLWLAAFIALAVLGLAAFAVHERQPWVAGIITSIDVVGLASVFVYQRRQQPDTQ